MKMRKIAALTITAVMLITVLAGCTTFDNFKEAFIDKGKKKDVTIQIGVYEPQSGADSDEAELEIEGIELANEVYPNIDGKIVELVYSDNASDIYAAETAIKNLIAKKPDVILGSYGSVYSLEAGPYINEAEIPAIAITNTNPLVTKNYDYYFRVCYVDSNQGDLLAKYVLEQKKELVAGVMMPEGDDAAMALATTFTDRIKAQTDNEDAIIAYEKYKPGAKDFTQQLSSIRNSGVKSVLLPGEITDSANIIKQAKSMGLDVVFLGDTEWAGNDFKKLVGNYANEKNTAFVNFYAVEETSSEEAEKFLDAYEKRYGTKKEPEDQVALGYDAYLIAIEAVANAGDNASGDKIRKTLAEMNTFSGASGDIKFNNFGDPIKTGYISTWDGSKIKSLCAIDPTL